MRRPAFYLPIKMKKIFYSGIVSYIFFEIANVYFIMPMPGSQEMNSIYVAYFLYSWRWVFRESRIFWNHVFSRIYFESRIVRITRIFTDLFVSSLFILLNKRSVFIR